MNSASIERNIMEFVISALYRAEDIEGAINAVLSSLGERFGVSRVYIFEDSADGTFSVNTFEWCALGIRPEIENLQHYPYEFENGENIYRRNFNSEGIFLCPDISELPEDQRAVLEPQGIRSMLQCALMDGAEFRGFIGFDECERRMEWRAEQVQTLSTISKLVATFLLKARHAEEAAFSSDFQAALDNSASYIFDR